MHKQCGYVIRLVQYIFALSIKHSIVFLFVFVPLSSALFFTILQILRHLFLNKTWLDGCLQIFEEEHNVWFLDKGGALVAVKQPSVPTRNLWYVHMVNVYDSVWLFNLTHVASRKKMPFYMTHIHLSMHSFKGHRQSNLRDFFKPLMIKRQDCEPRL